MDNGTPFLGRSLSSGGGNSESTRYEFDTEVLALVNEAYTMAKHQLMQHKNIVNKVVEDLLEKDILIGNEISDYISGESD